MSQQDAVFRAIEEALHENPAFRKEFGEGISASLERVGLNAAPTETDVQNILPRKTLAVASGQVITAEAFWWGYHFVIPEAAMKDFSSVGNVVTAFMALGGSVIAASGGALAPLVAIVAAYAAAELVLMQAIDKGKGVYLSATWISPALIIPTPIT